MKKAPLIFFSLIIFNIIPEVYAKSYALVLNGSSRMDKSSTENEFARPSILTALALESEGAEVSVLFSAKGIKAKEMLPEVESLNAKDKKKHSLGPENTADKEQKALQSTYDYVNKKLPKAMGATKENILNELKRLSRTTHSGDSFKFYINAHGFQNCDRPVVDNRPSGSEKMLETESSSDTDPNCKHEINIYDPVTGKEVKFSTNEIFPYLREMDQKGVEIDLILDSCHSGALKKEFTGLSNTCVVTGSSGNGVSYGCFEHDPPPPESVDFTSITEVLNYYNYRSALPLVQDDEFFKNNKCNKYLQDHFKKNISVKNNESIKSLFLKSYKHDQTLAQPAISSMVNWDYYKNDFYNNVFMNQIDYICLANVISSINLVLDWAKLGMDAGINLLKEKYILSINKYNKNIENQKVIKEKEKIAPSEAQKELALTEIAQLQKESQNIAKEVVKNERELMTSILERVNLTNKPKDPCDRPIKK